MSAGRPVPGDPVAQTSALIEVARGLDLARADETDRLAAAADARTRLLVDGFVHQAGPPPERFAWVALGSHARGELHCASDQDHALIWSGDRAASSSYAADLAAAVVAGLEQFGLRRCDGGYMADRWSLSLEDWVAAAHDRIEAPTPEAVLETDVFLDLRPLAGALDVTAAIRIQGRGADSPRLLHGLAAAATSFPPPLGAFGRLGHGPVDLKRGGVAPVVLLARLYGLRARSAAVGTVARLRAAEAAGGLSAELTERLVQGFALLTRLRLAGQLAQVEAGMPVNDVVVVADLPAETQAALRDAFQAIKAAQAVTAVTFRTDL
jgi:CBS domain-containing protein